jgi:ubiquinone/menaquinone biosynthesis C-methylase UbiE
MKKLNPLVSDGSVSAILEIANAFKKSKILLSACELDIFSTLGDEPKTSKEVAYDLGLNDRSVDRLMNALCCMQLLEKTGNKFTNTKGTRRFLVKGSPEYLGSMMHLTHMWDTWGTLTDVIRQGESVRKAAIDEKDDKWVSSFVNSMHRRSLLQAPDIVRMIDLNGVNKVLDLGCGSGLYSMEFVKAKPSIKVHALDYPKVIKYVTENLNESGMNSSITTMSGDVYSDDIGSEYDLVFVSFLLHNYSLWDNIRLLQKVYDSLNRGGTLVIQEHIIDDDRTKPEEAVVLSLHMLINTLGGDSFTETDLWIMLKEAWFKDFKNIKTEFGTNLIFAHK